MRAIPIILEPSLSHPWVLKSLKSSRACVCHRRRLLLNPGFGGAAWKEKLADHCDEVYKREGTNLTMVSERLCMETAEGLLEKEIRKPLEDGEFDDDFRSARPFLAFGSSIVNEQTEGQCGRAQ